MLNNPFNLLFFLLILNITLYIGVDVYTIKNTTKTGLKYFFKNIVTNIIIINRLIQ
ncbi:hypothetical protein OPLHCY645_01340 [Clostridium tetani]